MSEIPVVDIAAILAGTETPQMIADLDAACCDHGFFYVINHGLDAEIEELWRESHRFFEQPRLEKQKLMRSKDNPLGYFDRELTKQMRDQKEVFDFLGPLYDGRNRWPEDDAEFRRVMGTYFDGCTIVAGRIMGAICKALGLPMDRVSDAFGEYHTSMIRLNHYPEDDPLERSERDSVNALGDMALHHHTDVSGITLLLQDDVGGLQALSREGWIDVPPLPGSIIVNVGDMSQVWSNDRYHAAMHRVQPCDGRARFSVPFFYQPNPRAIISPIAEIAGETPAYRTFSWKEFVSGRDEGNFGDYGAETQLSDFKVDAVG